MIRTACALTHIARSLLLSSSKERRKANLLCSKRLMSTGSSAKLSLPTLDRLQAAVPDNVDAVGRASAWVEKLSDLLSTYACSPATGGISVESLFVPDAFWKDTLALTWDYRAIHGVEGISSLLRECTSSSGLTVNASAIATDPYRAPAFRKPFLDISWIQFGFDLETSVGNGQGYARLVPTSEGIWKAYTLWTSLESLHAFTPVSSCQLDFDRGHIFDT